MFREDLRGLTKEDIRGFLKGLKDSNPGAYKNMLSALKVFYRDYLGMPESSNLKWMGLNSSEEESEKTSLS